MTHTCFRMQFLLLALFAIIAFSGTSYAQNSGGRTQKEIMQFVEAVATFCSDGKWTKSRCYKVVADSNTVLVANYMAELQSNGHMWEEERMKNGCAAATALDEVRNLKREAAASAVSECYNTFVEVADMIDIVPNPTHFQIFMAAVYCYRTDQQAACDQFNKSLKAYKRPGF